MRPEETTLSPGQRYRIAKARSLRLLSRGTWNEAEHPRDPAGTSTGGQFTGGGATGESEKPKDKPKKKATKDDFKKAKIVISGENEDAFVANWNEKIGEDPAAFKQEFMGGLDGTMTLSGVGDSIDIHGTIQQDGEQAGSFTRNIGLNSKSAYSAYFALSRGKTKADIGKKLLAGNIETYQRLGIEKVSVTANIDVGGYAWAKYGYVPTQSAWNSLRSTLETRLTGGARSSSRERGGNTVEADDWDMLGSDRQDAVRDEWMRVSRDEFIQSETDNWRESGQALQQAKVTLTEEFDTRQRDAQGKDDRTGKTHTEGEIGIEWVEEAIAEVREARAEAGKPEIPYTDYQLFRALQVEEYESKYDDGKADPEISFDDDMLREPAGHEAAAGQMTLPGIEPEDLSQRLSEDMRDELTARLERKFNDKAESDEQDIEPPDYLAESADQYMSEYWEELTDSDRLRIARDNDMADIEVEPDEEEEPEELELEAPEKDPLLDALRNSSPKSIWKVADHPRGKELLLGTNWSGVLNLKDAESMARFKAYVGKKKHG